MRDRARLLPLQVLSDWTRPQAIEVTINIPLIDHLLLDLLLILLGSITGYRIIDLGDLDHLLRVRYSVRM